MNEASVFDYMLGMASMLIRGLVSLGVEKETVVRIVQRIFHRVLDKHMQRNGLLHIFDNARLLLIDKAIEEWIEDILSNNSEPWINGGDST